jgi:D-sedoheptulose 7-phosphate isomerase
MIGIVFPNYPAPNIMPPMKRLLQQAIDDMNQLLPKLAGMSEPLQKLGDALIKCWEGRGKVLCAGNGGSAADAMHLAEELCVRFMKNRKALAAIALADPTVLTCAGNDFGFDSVFARQVEALGNAGDVLVVFTTSGNSANILKAIEQAKSQKLITVAFLGKDGGKAKGQCDIEFIIPSKLPHRIQEGHQILFHTLCEWVDERVK